LSPFNSWARFSALSFARFCSFHCTAGKSFAPGQIEECPVRFAALHGNQEALVLLRHLAQRFQQ
jgi:hypothetical protein